VDKPIAGLLKDLKARGLLKDTLVIWSGEFGRTRFPKAATGAIIIRMDIRSLWPGGGVKAGFAYGATDESAITRRKTGCTSMISTQRCWL